MLARLFAEVVRALRGQGAVRERGSQAAGAPEPAQAHAALLTALRQPLAHPKNFNYETVAWMTAAMRSGDYMVSRMMGANNLVGRAELLAFAVDQCGIPGLVMEFGVYRGASLAEIARRAGQTVHGFDSFEGLPKDWTYYQKRGRFGLGGVLPDLDGADAQLHKGWFEQTLPPFLLDHPGPARFVHIDCDLYSSTRTVLDLLAPRIVPGTVVLFDEYLNYPGWEQHEFRAFQEFVARTGIRYSYIGFASAASSVAVRIDQIEAAAIAK